MAVLLLVPLALLAVMALFAVMALWMWPRRDLYVASWRMAGPVAWPIVGNALLFWDIPSTYAVLSSKVTKHTPYRFYS